jgi:hypothetical protein
MYEPYDVKTWDAEACKTRLANNDTMKALYFAQYFHESRRGNSALAMEHNNLFGMKPSKSRKQFYTGIVEYNGEMFATYDHPLHSIEDVLDRNEYFGVTEVLEPQDALNYLIDLYRSKYFTDNPANYIKGVLAHARENYPEMKWPGNEQVDQHLGKSGISTMPVLVVLGIAAAILWLWSRSKRKN